MFLEPLPQLLLVQVKEFGNELFIFPPVIFPVHNMGSQTYFHVSKYYSKYCDHLAFEIGIPELEFKHLYVSQQFYL